MECDPVSVRVVRIFGFIESRGWSVYKLFEKLHAPAPEKVTAATFVGDELTARSEKQQALIFNMKKELEQLRNSQTQAQTTQIAAKKSMDRTELTYDTLAGYRELLVQFGYALLDNSAQVKEVEHPGKKQLNPVALRAAVARLVGASPGTGDAELTRMVRELAESLPGE
jgi:hypothetical protein